MSIYATLWQLKFPRDGDDYLGCEWITVIAQGVPPHIGSPTPGCGYEDGYPYAAFLPPPVHTNTDGESEYMRAVVFVTENTPKGTERSPQRTSCPRTSRGLQLPAGSARSLMRPSKEVSSHKDTFAVHPMPGSKCHLKRKGPGVFAVEPNRSEERRVGKGGGRGCT